VEQKTQS